MTDILINGILDGDTVKANKSYDIDFTLKSSLDTVSITNIIATVDEKQIGNIKNSDTYKLVLKPVAKENRDHPIEVKFDITTSNGQLIARSLHLIVK